MTGTEITSKFLSLQSRDFYKGLIIAALSPILTFIYQSAMAHSWVIDWPSLRDTAISAGAAYLIKNLLEPTKTIIVVKPPLSTENEEKPVTITEK